MYRAGGIIVLSFVAAVMLMPSNAEILLEQELSGPHICRTLEQYPVEVTTSELQSYQERGSTWCLKVPPRCSTYRLKHRTVNKTQILQKTRMVRDCCAGYKRNASKDGCIPECTQKCQHGKCIAPDKCKCDHGYGGPACDISSLNALSHLLSKALRAA